MQYRRDLIPVNAIKPVVLLIIFIITCIVIAMRVKVTEVRSGIPGELRWSEGHIQSTNPSSISSFKLNGVTLMPSSNVWTRIVSGLPTIVTAVQSTHEYTHTHSDTHVLVTLHNTDYCGVLLSCQVLISQTLLLYFIQLVLLITVQTVFSFKTSFCVLCGRETCYYSYTQPLSPCKGLSWLLSWLPSSAISSSLPRPLCLLSSTSTSSAKATLRCRLDILLIRSPAAESRARPRAAKHYSCVE